VEQGKVASVERTNARYAAPVLVQAVRVIWCLIAGLILFFVRILYNLLVASQSTPSSSETASGRFAEDCSSGAQDLASCEELSNWAKGRLLMWIEGQCYADLAGAKENAPVPVRLSACWRKKNETYESLAISGDLSLHKVGEEAASDGSTRREGTFESTSVHIDGVSSDAFNADCVLTWYPIRGGGSRLAVDIVPNEGSRTAFDKIATLLPGDTPNGEASPRLSIVIERPSAPTLPEGEIAVTLS
jgi:hypothetical protein